MSTATLPAPLTVSLARMVFFAAIERLLIRAAFLNFDPIIAETWTENYEDSRMYKSSKTIDLHTLIGMIRTEYRVTDADTEEPEDYPAQTGRNGRHDEVAAAVANIDRIIDHTTARQWIYGCYEAGDVRVGFIGTEEQLRERDLEEERTRLETAAGQLAREWKVNPASDPIAFLTKLDEAIADSESAIDNYNSHEVRMEEYAAHRYAGCTGEYYNNRDFTGGRLGARLDTLRGIREWIGQACPLGMFKYHEHLMSQKE